MSDERDFRIKIDLTFPPNASQYADKIKDLLLPLYEHAIVINPDPENRDGGYIKVERCGHRLKLPCDTIAQWNVGEGRVI